MPLIEGQRYTYRELAQMSGLAQSTIINRYRENPDITLKELTRPRPERADNARFVIVEGKEIPLYEWAKMNVCSKSRIDGRWYLGIRDPETLVAPPIRNRRSKRPPEPKPAPSPMPGLKHLTPEQKAWLRETEHARAGMTYRWKIACDLLGLPRSMADWVRREMEEDNAGGD